MRKIVLFSLFALMANYAFSQKTLVGGGFIYGTDINKGGIDVRGDFRVAPNWAIVPNINFFFPDNSDTYKSSLTGFNVDAHYLFGLSSEANIYPLFGLNFSKYAFKEKTTDTKFSNTELGINIGGGIEYFFSSKVAGLFELKYVLGDYDQGVFTFGVLYVIN